MSNGTTYYFETPNLDALDLDDLQDLRNVFSALTRYIEYKRQAMRDRLTGNIGNAKHCERKMDDEYKNLPNWAKW